MPQVMERPAAKATRNPRSSVNFSVRMSSKLKTQSEELYHALGMPLTTAIQVFLKKSLAVGGLSFELKVSPPPIPNCDCYKIMAAFSRDPREHWFKTHFSKNEVANSGYTIVCAETLTTGDATPVFPHPLQK